MSHHEANIEKFIRENKDKFSTFRPPDNHIDKFLFKLNLRIRNIISIVPHLVKVFIATVFIFSASILVWNNFIRRDRHEIKLNDKISLIIKGKSH